MTGLQWARVLATVKGSINLTNLEIVDVSLEGPRGKTGTLDFSDAQFATLLGSENEKELWLECVLTDSDSRTVCEGPILLKRPMP